MPSFKTKRERLKYVGKGDKDAEVQHEKGILSFEQSFLKNWKVFMKDMFLPSYTPIGKK